MYVGFTSFDVDSKQVYLSAFLKRLKNRKQRKDKCIKKIISIYWFVFKFCQQIKKRKSENKIGY